MSTAVRSLVITATFAGIVTFYVWTASTSGMTVRLQAGPTGYYNLLAEGFLGGHLYIPVTPNPALLALPDPYDPVANAPFRLHDATLYRGRYFLYFGPTPALILFAPFKAVTGRHLPEPIAIAAGCALGVLSAFLLLRHLVSAGFRVQPPTWLWAVALVTLGLANVAPFLLRRPAVYEVAISAGYGLVFTSLLALALGAIGPRPRPAWLAVSGVLLGLAAGARFPLFAAGLASAVALAYWAWPGRLTPRDRLRVAVAVAAPLALAALAIGWYNYARFDSWTEFGIRYTLQGVNPKAYDMFDARRPIYGLMYYLVVPIYWSATFPFANLAPERFLPPPPYLYLEPVAGILATTPLLAALAAGPWLLRRRPLLQACAGTLAAIGTVLLVVFASAGMTMRYEVDFTTFFLVPAVLMWMMAILTSPPGTFRRQILAGGLLALAAFGGATQVLISFTGYYDNLRGFHPQTYATLRSWAGPIEQALGVPDPRIALVKTPNGLETVEGRPFFWMGGGPTQLHVLSRTARTVVLRAEFDPGPSADPALPARQIKVEAPGLDPKVWEVSAGIHELVARVDDGESIITLTPMDDSVTKVLPNGDVRLLLVGVRNLEVLPYATGAEPPVHASPR